MTMKTGAEIIADERQRQIDVEGYTPETDSFYLNEELVSGAVAYLLPTYDRDDFWPWHPQQFKLTPGNRIKELAKAGALIAAEIDRRQRKGLL